MVIPVLASIGRQITNTYEIMMKWNMMANLYHKRNYNIYFERLYYTKNS